MSWLKSLRGRKDDESGTAGGEQDISAMGGEPEPNWFRPRSEGTYVSDGDGPGRYLRFYAVGRVYLADGPADAATARNLLGPDNTDPTVGQFTGAGRFTVQKKFERPIVCTVLGFDEADPTVFTARVTTTDIARTVSEHRYTYAPDVAPD